MKKYNWVISFECNKIDYQKAVDCCNCIVNSVFAFLRLNGLNMFNIKIGTIEEIK